MPTSLEIRQTTASTPLSRQQKQFNQLIKKIEQQKHLLLEWQQAVQEYNQILAKEIIPLQDELQEQKTALIYLFDAAYPNKLFKKTDKQKLSH